MKQKFLQGVLCGIAALTAFSNQAHSQSYTDPGSASYSYLNPGGASGAVVTFLNGPLALGDVKVRYWVFQDLTQASGYFYTYQVINNTAGSIAHGLSSASLTFFDIADINPFIELGDGAGLGVGATYRAWNYTGDDTSVASWVGTNHVGTNSSIMPGQTSPSASDAAPMFEIYSRSAPGFTTASISTLSGGGYTGQALNLMAPTVPEPSAIAAISTGLISMLSLRKRKKA